MNAETHNETAMCDECDSPFLTQRSAMSNLCPECAHHLYGYPNCTHAFVAGRCTLCLWNGAVSPFVKALQAE